MIATLYAHRYAQKVLGLVNVEANSTHADAFWSAELARKPALEPEAWHRAATSGLYRGAS